MADLDHPLVSVVLTTRDRPRLLKVALACYAHQKYDRRELIVVDDGDRFPVDEAAIKTAGGQLVRVEPGTRLGTKLNTGLELAQGYLCQKMDDDDWYGPQFMQAMVSQSLARWTNLCAPTVAFLSPFLFFNIADWQVRQSEDNHMPGATLLFHRESWKASPFRALATDEDVWFFFDQVALGAFVVKVDAVDSYMAVRHGGHGQERGHTWTHQMDGRGLEDFVRRRPLHRRGPESILPAWALSVYQDLRRDLTAPRR